MNDKIMITPKTKVGEFLEAYPELEDVLIDMAPSFKKLKNPVLRKTIAKIASLEQAAAIGDIPIDILINKLRGLAGQDEMEIIGCGHHHSANQDSANHHSANQDSASEPEWLDRQRIVKSHDAREEIMQGGHPLVTVMREIQGFGQGDIYEFTTPFLPAPLLEKVTEQGFKTWTKRENESQFINYLIKK